MKYSSTPSQTNFFDRDISWLSFNERVLMEAEREAIPLAERLKFLAIYSSNLDEFYRVRIASLMAMKRLGNKTNETLESAHTIIEGHQQRYGQVLAESIIPSLRQCGIEFLYNVEFPELIQQETSNFFYNHIARYINVVKVNESTTFFPENNKIYFVVTPFEDNQAYVVNIPSDHLNRFHSISLDHKKYVVTIDDIVRQHLNILFNTKKNLQPYAFKITRDAELNLKDEVPGSITKQMEKLLAKRDYGLATRFLYDASMPKGVLKKLIKIFKLKGASTVAGGRYHNLKDFFAFPLGDTATTYKPQPPVAVDMRGHRSVFSLIEEKDLMIHTPFHSYDLVLRFFSEAAIDPTVEKINVTLYRIASQSAIAQALMSAACNGKKVTATVELKARFDEGNNIRWAKRMKAAGVTIIYSSASLKVHAKIATVKRRVGKKYVTYGLLSTGNFNESTARLYTDHILFTANTSLVDEVLGVFKVLSKQKKSLLLKKVTFGQLIVAPFNIRERFFSLIDREITNAKQKVKAAITIKLNNLEEETLIDKLYEASSAGVDVHLFVRSICRLIPGRPGISERITVRRIVDRYLEHGRVFIFYNNGNEEVFCGSADWMNRNIYHRVEVCFPILDRQLKEELKHIIHIQGNDTLQAVMIDDNLKNIPIPSTGNQLIRSQESIYTMIADRHD